MNTVTALAKRTSSPSVGIFKILLLGIPLLVLTIGFLVWRAQVSQLRNRVVETYGVVPSFQLVNQDGQRFGSEQLDGKIWIADFVFTSCPGPCPMISSRMSELQKPLATTDVHLVSFSVDPEKDTPEVLRGYAERLHAERQRWDFLTGAKAEIYRLSKNGFNLAATDGSAEAGIPVHSTRIVLVDRHREIRGYYDALASDAVTKIVADTKHLLRDQPK